MKNKINYTIRKVFLVVLFLIFICITVLSLLLSFKVGGFAFLAPVFLALLTMRVGLIIRDKFKY